MDGPLTHGIFRKSANAQKVRELKAAIDNGTYIHVIVWTKTGSYFGVK